MIPVQALFETHLTVTDLDRAIEFYRDIVGLKLAHVAAERGAAFFWVGPDGASMLGLWATGSGPQTMRLHTAFRATLADVIEAPGVLQAAGITPLDSYGRPTTEPVVFTWMPAASVFFRDRDGNLLEYIAPLSDVPRPDHGVVPWHVWGALTRHASPAPRRGSSRTR